MCQTRSVASEEEEEKEKVTQKAYFFVITNKKVYIELSYSPKFELLKCILSQGISLQRSPKFGIGNRHFETNAQRPGRARPLSVTPCRSRDFCSGKRFCTRGHS